MVVEIYGNEEEIPQYECNYKIQSPGKSTYIPHQLECSVDGSVVECLMQRQIQGELQVVILLLGSQYRVCYENKLALLNLCHKVINLGIIQ